MAPGEVLGTGIEALDALLPDGGFPLGRLSELSGSRSSGKRTIAAALCAQALRAQRSAVWIDGTGGFYPLPALEFGAPLERLLVVRVPSPKRDTTSSEAGKGASGRAAMASAPPRDATISPAPCFVSGLPNARTRLGRKVAPPVSPAIKAADLLMQAGNAAALVVIDLPAQTSLPPRQLARLRLAAEQCGAAVVFVTEKPISRESLGTFICLHVTVKRDLLSRLRVTIRKSKLGQMARQATVSVDGPHSLCMDSTV